MVGGGVKLCFMCGRAVNGEDLKGERELVGCGGRKQTMTIFSYFPVAKKLLLECCLVSVFNITVLLGGAATELTQRWSKARYQICLSII